MSNYPYAGTLGQLAGEAGNSLGIYGGLQQGQQGNPAGYARAGVNAGELAGKAGWLGSSNSAANQGVGDAADALGIYSGIKQGGVSGDASAAVNAAKLGSATGAFGAASPAIGTAAGYAAIPLDLYNEVNSWRSGATGSDALSGAETGAAVGSMVLPGFGTVIGGALGAIGGALSSLAGPGATDPETQDVQHLIDYTGANQGQNNMSAAAGVQNPYLQLAGLMDERSSTLPEYQQYGRMGEQAFTNDLVKQINNAASSGQFGMNPDGSITMKDSSGNDVIFSGDNAGKMVYNNVVAPWVNKMGSGYNNVGQTYSNVNAGLLEDMTNQYMSGQAAQDWQSVGGQNTFSNIYQNSPFKEAAAPASTETPAMSNRPIAGNQMGKMMAADGGHAKRRSVLDSIRPSFKDVPHFDSGGSAYYDLYFTPATYNSPAYDFNLDPVSQDQNSPIPDSGTPSADQIGLNSINYGSDSSGGSGSGGLGGLLGGLGSLAHSAAPYAALAPILASLLGSKSSSGSSGTPSGQTTGPTQPFQAQASPRTANAIDPNTDWYTYGQHPETQFFSNNSIGPLMGSFVSPQASQPTATTPPGTANTQPIISPSPLNRARGGALDSLNDGTPVQGHEATGESRYVTGAGDGQSDDIDAKLSNGEYVMDAHTVSLLGNGSNEAGAKRLDQLRENLRKDAAKPMAKGKQFMKVKDPAHYLRGGSK